MAEAEKAGVEKAGGKATIYQYVSLSYPFQVKPCLCARTSVESQRPYLKISSPKCTHLPREISPSQHLRSSHSTMRSSLVSLLGMGTCLLSGRSVYRTFCVINLITAINYSLYGTLLANCGLLASSQASMPVYSYRPLGMVEVKNRP